MVTTLCCHGAGYPRRVLDCGGRAVQRKAGARFLPWGTLGSDLDDENQLEKDGRVKRRQRGLEESLWVFLAPAF